MEPTAAPARIPLAYRQTAVYYLAFIALGMTSASLGVTLPDLAARTGVSLGAAGILFTLRMVGYLIGSLLGGRLYDHWRGQRVQAGALLLLALGLALAPQAATLILLGAAFVVAGIGEGTLDVGGNTLLVWVHGDRVGPFMNALHLFFGVGSFLAPLLLVGAMSRGGVTGAYLLLAGLLLPVALLLWRVPSPAIPRLAAGETAAPLDVPLVALFVLFFFLNVGAEASFGGWIFSYAQTVFASGGATLAAGLTSLFWGTFSLGRLVGIPIAARVRPRLILLADLGLITVGLLILALLPPTPTLAWLGVGVTGLGMASVFATTMTMAGRHIVINGRTTGLFFIGTSAGAAAFPWLLGQVFERLGPAAILWVLIATQAAALGVWALLLLATRAREGG
jgi:fucose permease